MTLLTSSVVYTESVATGVTSTSFTVRWTPPIEFANKVCQLTVYNFCVDMLASDKSNKLRTTNYLLDATINTLNNSSYEYNATVPTELQNIKPILATYKINEGSIAYPVECTLLDTENVFTFRVRTATQASLHSDAGTCTAAYTFVMSIVPV